MTDPAPLSARPSRLRALASRWGLLGRRATEPNEPNEPAAADVAGASARRIVVQRVVPGRKGVTVTLQIDPPDGCAQGESLLRLKLDRLAPDGGAAPPPLLWPVGLMSPVGPPEAGTWRTTLNWPAAATWPSPDLFGSLSVSPLRRADRVELSAALAAQLPHLWPADEEAILTAFARRATRFGDVDYQFEVALRLWSREAATPVRQVLALILGYGQLDLATERPLPEATRQLLDTLWHPGDAPLPTLEARRRGLLWHRALWRGDLADAQALIDQAIVPIESLADPLVAAEQVMRARAMRQILQMQAGQVPQARLEAEALLRDLMAVTEHADPRRLRDFIDHRKCFQLTSLARKLVRPRTLQQSAEVQRVLDLAVKSALNVGAAARQRIAAQIGVELAG